eukprot:m.693477 g.693477  ORF g.693477 m.693477 type:complete len:76 (-) comp22872_c1_seq5:3539-3766(-)
MSRPVQPHTKAPELDAQHAAEKKAKGKKSHGVIKLRIFFDTDVGDLVVQVYEARDLKSSGGMNTGHSPSEICYQG